MSANARARPGNPRGMPQERELERGEKRTVALLGLPTMALSLSVTVTTTYLPTVAHAFVASNVVIGLIIGLEGLMALWLPLVVGTWSDQLDTRLGGRLPFLIGASPIVVAGLFGMAFVGSTLTLAAAALVFFFGYFVAYEPYRALYPDAVGEEAAGRAQGTQALWRGVGTGLALLGGGLLLGLGRGAPFLAAAAAYLVCVATFAYVLARRGVPRESQGGSGNLREEARHVVQLVRDHGALQAFLVANALWELSLAALKTFVVLYVTRGLGFSRTEASLLIGAVAVVVLLAALASGKLADRHGRLKVLQAALPVYGLGFLVPLVFTAKLAVALAIPFIAVGGGVLMALPYAILIPLMPEDEHGALTGYYSLSRGLGTWFGPLLAGIAVTAFAGVFSATDGYQAVWGVCALTVLTSIVPTRRLRRHADE
jgi:MFS family permease